MKNQDCNARVIAQHRGKYLVRNNGSELWAEITGKMMFTAESKTDYPIVGDIVKISEPESGHAVILKILPRKTLLQRKEAGTNEIQPIAANIDVAFIVQAVDRDFNLNRIARYLTIIREGKISPVIVLNKTDLISKDKLEEKISQIKDRYKDIDVLKTCAADGSGIEELHRTIKSGHVYCFVGSSGVGKSSIINKLLGKEIIKTKILSVLTNKGRHTTTHRQLYILENGGMVIDNPGMREVGVADMEEAVADVFDDLSALAKSCKFADCTHIHEPGCAVLRALESGLLNKEQYLNYIKIKKESDHYAMSSIEKKRKDRSFGKMVKNFKKQKKKLK